MNDISKLTELEKVTEVNAHDSLKDIDLFPIERLNEFKVKFYVPRYQRGYRWGQTEIELLLNDINDVELDQKYCLQPVSVTWKEEGQRWELIDGQQRMTTLYLIFKALDLDEKKLYQLDYDTRKSTLDFLKNIKTKTEGFLDLDLEKIMNNWKAIISENKSDNNIDNFHLFQAYTVINKWVKKHNDLNLFKDKLLSKTNIIWHPLEIGTDSNDVQSAEDFFIKMNAGKIKLTSAELIKALFILEIENRDESWDLKTIKKKKLANEWDYIENELSDDLFWFFINNEEKGTYQTRIGKLFDLDCRKPNNADELYAYRFYAKKDKLDWEKIKHLFNRFKEWYDNVSYFHKIGFLINSGFKQLETIIEKTENSKKSKIDEKLNEWICDGLEAERQKDNERILSYELDNLNYEEKPGHCRVILLLYNILLIEKQFPGQRFPFHFYNDPDLKWSLEHIHPQSAKDIEAKEDLESLLSDYKSFIEDKIDSGTEEDNEMKKKFNTLQDEIKNKTFSLNKKKELFEEFVEEYKDKFELHSIGNLALLDKRTNSKLSNKPFLSKRKVVLDLSQDFKSLYIPLGTINCFLKKTTEPNFDSKNIQMKYWSPKDMDNYKNHISVVLNQFLPKN